MNYSNIREKQINLPFDLNTLLFCVFKKGIKQIPNTGDFYQTYRLEPCRVIAFQYYGDGQIDIEVVALNDNNCDKTYTVDLGKNAFIDYAEAESYFYHISQEAKGKPCSGIENTNNAE